MVKLDVFNSRGERAVSVEVAGHPLDSCECGDYRRDHADGLGACRHNKPRDLTHGYRDCTGFRLARSYDAGRAALKDTTHD